MDNEKSHVSLEQHLCLVCGLGFDTGGILLDRRLAHLRREALARVVNVALAPDVPCVFVEPGVIEQLQAMVGPGQD